LGRKDKIVLKTMIYIFLKPSISDVENGALHEGVQ
jgi:hypothetical protein